MMLASPLQMAAGASQSSHSKNQVVPTVLSGYKGTGTLPASTVVDVALGIPLQNMQELQYLEQQIATPGSPLFHQFLTTAEAQRFLPTTEFQTALAYLTQSGLKVVTTGLDSVIVAQGTVAQVSQSLGLEYQKYSNGQSSYYAASGVSPIPGVYLYSSNYTAVLLSHPPDLLANDTTSPLYSTRPTQSNQTLASGTYQLPDLQTVYNATGLFARGDTGAGFTAGILDFEGDPYIAQQLQYFDGLYGLPASPFKVIPIGAYNPSLGVYTGWAPEISLDVESVHAMAPRASIDLYIANEALPLSAVIAAIVQQGLVNDLSQSFSEPESVVSSLGPSSLEMNVIMTDQYYLLGSAEGMSFLAASGDVGGSGFSAGPEGTPGYPSTSPYVTAVGGTTTYLAFDGSRVSSFYQTAWSNYGFVPDQVNYGGGTGGVSVLEPRPWYQSPLSSPAGFASGRLVPDLSLNANGLPGVTVVFPGNLTGVEGGTSESSPLLAGLLTLLMSSSKSPLGLINPTLYSIGENASAYPKAYYPITYGYTIPWVSQTGYNMATGWGAPNIGEMANYIGDTGTPSLGVNVTATVKGIPEENLLPGQLVSVSAKVTGAATVTAGSFSAALNTLSGVVATAPLTYNPSAGAWDGQLMVPNNGSGISYLTVTGSSGGMSGTGFAEFFTGYVATFFSPAAGAPYSGQFGIDVAANFTTLSGALATGSFKVADQSYSIRSNTYTSVATTTTSRGSTGFGTLWSGTLNGNFPDGPAVLVAQGDAYGFLPFVNGVDMQASFIETTVLTEPGAVGPGQSIFILSSLEAPVNTPSVQSAETGLPVAVNVDVGSNVTAYLVSQSGNVVASAQLYMNSFLSTIQSIQGAMTVPSGLQPGLYDVILNSTFNSNDLGVSIDGSYFGQVYVASTLVTPSITVSQMPLYEGQTVTVNARIDYSNGSSIKYGLYTATVYPTDLQNSYNALTVSLPINLAYESSTGLWTANVTLPSAYNAGGTLQIDQGALYLSGPYDVFVTGISADGVPSNTDISTQQGIVIQPYLLLNGRTLTSLQQSSQLALVGDTVVGPAIPPANPSAVLTNDVFIGSNTIQGGTVAISESQIKGTLYVNDAKVTLSGVTGGAVVAVDSKIVVQQSSLSSLQLTNSQVSINDSAVAQVSPPAPNISIQSPSSVGAYSGTSGSFTVAGTGVTSVSVYLDGALIQSYSGAASYNFPLDGISMAVGVHSLEVVAAQQDGLSSSTSVYFATDGPLVAANDSISSLSTQVSSQSSRIGALNTQLSQLNSQLNSPNYLSYGLGVLAIVALLIALVAVARKPSSQRAASPPAPSPAPSSEPQTPPVPPVQADSAAPPAVT